LSEKEMEKEDKPEEVRERKEKDRGVKASQRIGLHSDFSSDNNYQFQCL
jgi:hypothetical protein